MAANKIVRIGPVGLTATLTTNLLNPPSLAGGTGIAGTNTGTYLVLRHLRITNKTAAIVTFSMFLGASGGNVAGTEVFGSVSSVPANSSVDWYGMMRMDVADYLVGGAASASALTLEAEAELGVA